MCGICGRVYFDPQRQVDAVLLQRMCEALKHRGPDESGVYANGHVGLGHRRLRIIDLATGQQPMRNQRQDLWLTYNGEIYNFPELRQDLAQHGYRFRSTSDTEVLIQLYDEYGTACVNYLRGMFAFALWDQRCQRLFLARDRVGKKPLFYIVTAEAITFASEIKALLQDPAVPRQLNLTALSDYLTYQYVPPPETIFEHIRKLPPAHFLVCEQGRVTLARYWDLAYVPKVTLAEPELRARLTALLQEAVRIRLISDVPLGAFLSGGVDSSLIVALMAQYSSQPVKTFSIGFQEQDFNELPYARLIAQRYHTEHHELIVEPNAVEILPALIWHFDEPFGDSSAIPMYYLAQMTSPSVKVALNGDGGDESFAGYLRYAGSRLVRAYRKLPAQLLRALGLETPPRLYARAMTIFPDALKAEVLTADVRARLRRQDSLDDMLQYFQRQPAAPFTDQMLRSDVMTYLPGDLLVKTDRMTMAHGLEGRSPFLDHKLMEFAATLPPQCKLRGGRLKVLLKKAAQPWVPAEILARRKQGFAVPLGDWFRHELRAMLQDLLGASALVQAGICNAAPLRRLLQEHQRGQHNHCHRIWLLLNLELWYRKFITNQ